MGGHEQPLPRHFRRRSSAVARWALFFALVACVLSASNLLLIWRDGELVRNARLLTEEIGRQLDKRREARQSETPAAPTGERPADERSADTGGADQPAAGPLNEALDNLSWRLERIGAMIRDKDARARLHLDVLRDDLESWRETTTAQGGEWIDRALTAVQSARRDFEQQAPQAADHLLTLAGQIRERMPAVGRLNPTREPMAPASEAGAEP
ncbi:MAG TPA: hypothetical protein PLS90_12215 [Candidatus Sumerlaeota bacterium]|nr:hypothetical protein [Candidatus Sumerlaeota bacterium]